MDINFFFIKAIKYKQERPEPIHQSHIV